MAFAIIGVFLPLCVMGQYGVVGTEQVVLGIGANRNGYDIDCSLNSQISKRSTLGFGANMEFGKVFLSKYYTYNIAGLYGYNLYSMKLHKYLDYKYFLRYVQELGLGYEYIYNAKKDATMGSFKYTTGIGIENIFTYMDWEFGIRLSEQFDYKSELGNSKIITYTMIMPLIKYTF